MAKMRSNWYLLFLPPLEYLQMTFFNVVHQMVTRMPRAQLFSDCGILS